MRAQVIVLAGPSGSGKTRLARRLGLPVLNLDDFYRDGSDPSLPRLEIAPGELIVDWDDPGSWLHDDALEAVAQLSRDGTADVPVYEIARDGRTGYRTLDLGRSRYFLAEGIFAQEIVGECEALGFLAAAICVRHHRLVTFALRLVRDLREHRKPPHVLVRRGLMLMRGEPSVVDHAVALGCTPMTPNAAYEQLSALLLSPDRAPQE